ncbi:peptidoglycan DD-metalloendopeptidase family protein [Bacillus sp. 1NLA3E]|uniref:peptidoglycan DD-metalloendopeptidase family protein n=1 Tax=Bacillus sp. 1NLA3E TaxID=666686 RepID=UPI000247E337|nr:peptidoglycan DD-metalloendopeptidase family protein [Bacillus sp. 1NLA3E]
MQDFIQRYLIPRTMALLCICLLFSGGIHSDAQTLTIKEQTAHWIWPSNGVITDLYGTRKGVHKGIDIAAEMGSPIYAVAKGVVSRSYYSDSYGNVVFIKHSNLFETVYAHLKSRNVFEGKAVKQGEVIGRMGNTGDSSGVHLHFEIHQNEWTFEKQNAIDPVMALGEVGIGKYVFADIAKSLEVSGRSQLQPQPNGQLPAAVNESNLGAGYQGNGEIVHSVKPGETLWSIAKRYGTNVETISAINHLKSNQIIPQQTLIVQ